MKLGEWIKNYRIEHSISMQAFADLCGFSKAYVSILENNINPSTKKPVSPTMQTFKKIASATGQDLNNFIESLDDNQPVALKESPSSPLLKHTKRQGVRIPVLGRVVAGIPLEAITDILDYEEIPPELAKTGEFFALQVKGSSMEPRLYDGDVVIVRRQPNVESGEIAIVLINGDEATIKQVKKEKNGIMLIGHNTAIYEPHFYNNEDIENMPVEILGKVIELRRKF